jgi:hypothetical protein
MSNHQIYLHFPRPLEVVNADAVIEVRSGDQHFGDLYVSRGSVDWRPTRYKKSYSMEWERFDELMRGNVQGHKPRSA